MTQFIMMVGLSGSGKSTIASKIAIENNTIIISSDSIRKELFGDEEIQKETNKIFEIAHRGVEKWMIDL